MGGVNGAQGNWTWTNGITLAAATTSAIDQGIPSTTTGRSLLLNGIISGSGNLVFKSSGGLDAFNNADRAYILTAANTMSGTVTIGGPTENGIAGRLTFLRVGGVGGISTSTAIGDNGSLGTASVVNNGVLTFR